MSKHKIIAVDFDGTVVKHEYPEVGADVPGAVEVLKRLNAAGVKIIVWTMRSGEYLDAARQWFETRGLDVWSYNSNPEQDWTESPKAYAQAYIDDAAIGCPLVHLKNGGRSYVHWPSVEEILEINGFLPEKK